MVPTAIIGLFVVRGLAQFASKYALSRIAADGMVVLRQQLFERLLQADLALFSRQSASQLPTPSSTRCRPAPPCWCRPCSTWGATASRWRPCWPT
jgi:ABC-type transport system involved in cytochrome bd biosynthesis fused ATPase/permease subunit